MNIHPKEVIAWHREKAKYHTEAADRLEREYSSGQSSSSNGIRLTRAVSRPISPEGSVTLDELRNRLMRKSGRIGDLAALFNVEDEKIRELISQSGGEIQVAERGWLKLRE